MAPEKKPETEMPATQTSAPVERKDRDEEAIPRQAANEDADVPLPQFGEDSGVE